MWFVYFFKLFLLYLIKIIKVWYIFLNLRNWFYRQYKPKWDYFTNNLDVVTPPLVKGGKGAKVPQCNKILPSVLKILVIKTRGSMRFVYFFYMIIYRNVIEYIYKGTLPL